MQYLRTAMVVIAAGAALALAPGEARSNGQGWDRGSIKDAMPSVTCCRADWNGLYVGAAVGGGIGTMTFLNASEGGGNRSFALTGAHGAVGIGYDIQLKPGFVAGVFTDYAFGEVDTTFSRTKFSIDDQWSIGGRLGLAPSCCTLWYAAAGYTQAKFEIAEAGRTIDEAMKGYFAGLGVEQALNKNLSLKLEYRFSDYRDFTILGTTLDNEVHAVRLGANWRFAR
jgi:outer membrane immunogenic protein